MRKTLEHDDTFKALSPETTIVPDFRPLLAELVDVRLVDTMPSYLASHPRASRREHEFTFRVVEDGDYFGILLHGYKPAYHGDTRDREAVKWVAKIRDVDPENLPDTRPSDLRDLHVYVECQQFGDRSKVVELHRVSDVEGRS